MQVQSLALISSLGSGIAMSCDVGRRCSLDPLLPWLWCRPAGVAPIQPLAWEPPYAVDADLKRQRTKKKKKRMYIQVYLNHFVIHLKLTQHCKEAILQ